MPVTGIQFVRNFSPNELLFQNAENNAHNRYVPAPGPTPLPPPGSSPSPSPGVAEVGDCWVPWCSSIEDFPRRMITILSMPSQKVLGYIWQDHDSNEDRVRYSRTGWSEPSGSNIIHGESSVGIKINLTVEVDGSIRAERYS
ncbi:MAG TPA: hypothetical protein VEG34_00025 [Thermoanaerobaculia bacterium]|nr:hypothetical protein [Thermoanaerobaculia bacterium]